MAAHSMFLHVFGMGFQHFRRDLLYALNCCLVIVSCRFLFFYLKRAGRAGAQAGAQPITVKILYQTRLGALLGFNYLDCLLGAPRNALSAPVAKFFVNSDDLSFHYQFSPNISKYAVGCLQAGHSFGGSAPS